MMQNQQGQPYMAPHPSAIRFINQAQRMPNAANFHPPDNANIASSYILQGKGLCLDKLTQQKR